MSSPGAWAFLRERIIRFFYYLNKLKWINQDVQRLIVTTSTDDSSLHTQQALYIPLYFCTQSGFSSSKKNHGRFSSYIKQILGRNMRRKTVDVISSNHWDVLIPKDKMEGLLSSIELISLL